MKGVVRNIIPALIAGVFAWPTQAEDIHVNEALVMRIIFEDCIDFVETNTPPFQGLKLLPITEEGKSYFPKPALETAEMRFLLSDRYPVAWGADDTTRYCMVMTNQGSQSSAQLGVQADGFLDRMTERSAAIGLTEANLTPPLSPLRTNDWSEQGDKFPEELRIVVLPTAVSDDEAVMDIGVYD